MHCTHDWWFFFKRLILRLLSFKIIACTLFKSNCNHGVIAYKNIMNAPCSYWLTFFENVTVCCYRSAALRSARERTERSHENIRDYF